MKLCPYCGKTLTEKALACKHCGEWLEDISDYLDKKGSVYAHSDTMNLTPDSAKVNYDKPNSNVLKHCIFCNTPVNLTDSERKSKEFLCNECGKKNIITNGRTDEVLKNVPIGWGWIILTVYYAFAVQKYLDSLDDTLQTIITSTLSVFVLLLTYFFVRRYILSERFEKQKHFGKIYNASIVSGIAGIIGVVVFVFVLHIIYPLTGLQSDRKETNMKVKFYNHKISQISERQKEINDVLAKPVSGKKEAVENTKLIDEYIMLNKEEKEYVDSIYKSLGESNYYADSNEKRKKIKEANILMNKIIAHKIMSAQNMKNYFILGDKNSLSQVKELNLEISSLSNEFSKNFKDLFLDED